MAALGHHAFNQLPNETGLALPLLSNLFPVDARNGLQVQPRIT